MWKRHLSFTISFGLIAVLDLITEILNLQEIRIYIKPLICIFLLGYLISKTRLYGTFSKLIFTGLLFSLLGDIAFILSGNNATLLSAGLGIYTLAHVFYSSAFYRDYKYHTEGSRKYANQMMAFVMVFVIIFFFFVQAYIPEMLLLVSVFVLSISAMGVLAGLRYKRVNLSSFRMILAGSIFLLISHSLLVIYKLVEPFLYSGALIMATYMLAQYLITMGTLERVVGVKKVKVEMSGQ